MTAAYSDRAISLLKEELGDDLLTVSEFRGEKVAVVSKNAVAKACELLKNAPELKFDFLACLTALDQFPEEPRFQIEYRLYSVMNNDWIGLRVQLPGDEAELPTIETVYPSANWHEREVFDMFGVRFSGNFDERRILMPHDWEGHPLRKDYPLGYEEVQFSFNFDEIDRDKPYAKE